MDAFTLTDLQGAVPDAIEAGVIILDRDGRIVQWNAWMVAASGRPVSEVVGKLLPEVFPDNYNAKLEGAISFAIRAGASSLLTHSLHPGLFPLRTRAGRTLLHDVQVSTVGHQPDVQCLIHVVDVTMAAHRERFLRNRQNARYDAVVASAPDGILTLDEDGIIRNANPAAALQFGYTADGLTGQAVTSLFLADDKWHDTWNALIKDQRIHQPVELKASRKDGTTTYLEVSASRWQTDSRVFVTAIFRDINERRETEAALRASEGNARATAEALADLNATLERRVQDRTRELMRAEESLRQSQKMEAIGQLTGGIAHDFNNLLQGIIGALDMVQKRIAEGRIGDIGRFAQGALASANRASALTHRLLAFSRRQPVDPRPVHINRLIGSMGELLRRSIGENIQMKIVAADDLWLVRCDANQLENALLNLAINARDAMAGGGILTVMTANAVLASPLAATRDLPAGEYVQLTVADTGSGMPVEVQARAFDPFYTTKPIGQGTGLGLSMIYGFVRQSGGSVRIESEVGKGTVIEICLPRFCGNLAPESAGEEDVLERQAGEDEVVLVVEDEDVVRLLVVEVLNDLGYLALEAVDGASAMRILDSSQRIDLLVTDIGLPDLNGRQVADMGRAKRSDLKVLFMTGYAENAAGNSFLGSGMEIISKPFTLDNLAVKIREIIER